MQEALDWNETLKITSSKSRIMIDGRRVLAPKFGLSERRIPTIERFAIEPEAMLGRIQCVNQFNSTLIKADVWMHSL